MNFEFSGGELGLPSAIGNGHRVGGRLLRLHADAVIERRPDVANRRLDRDGFRVGNAVAQLGFFAAGYRGRTSKKAEDFKTIAAHTLECLPVAVALLSGLGGGTFPELTILLCAGPEYPPDVA